MSNQFKRTKPGWRRTSRAIGTLCITGCLGGLAWASEPAPTSPPEQPMPRIVDPSVKVVQDITPQQPVAPTDPSMASAAEVGSIRALPSGFGRAGGDVSSLPQERQSAASSPSASAVSGAETVTRFSNDVGDLLNKSDSSIGVEVQRRSPIVTDPRIRGYHVGQIVTYADGGFHFPARLDLDTIVSKIDSSVIRDAIVLRGPYSVRYGPGFAFLDVETLETPRYACFEAHGSSFFGWKSNGNQLRGRQTVYGGAEDWGFRLGYLFNVGDDYTMGNGQELPTSFHMQTVDFAYGFDLTKNSKIEFKGIYQTQHDVLFPGLFFDLDRQETQTYAVHFETRNQDYFDRMDLDVWYNYTWLKGDAQRLSKRIQIPELNDPAFGLIAFTDAGTMSTGFSNVFTWGKEKEWQISLGYDMRYLSQELNEFDSFAATRQIVPDGFFNFPVPRSHMYNPGIFIDTTVPVSCEWTVKAGFRLDFVNTDIDDTPVGASDEFLAFNLGTKNFDREFVLWSAYTTSEYKLFDGMTALAGFGAGQRPPSLTELYAAQPFLAVVQNGLNFVVGDPTLRPEKLLQFDLGLRADYETFRAGANGFYAYVHDYITYDAFGSIFGNQGLGFNFVNTDRAILVGFESYVEVDVLDWLTPFATCNYVRGTDETRGDRTANFLGQQIGAGESEPLPGINPLDARLGIRIHESGTNPRWGVESSVRLVDDQNRAALSLGELPTGGFTIVDIRSYWMPTNYLTISAGVENVGDVFYREHLDLRTGLGVFQPGRNFYLAAEVRY